MRNSPNRRVVVTGLGAVSDVGLDVPTMWESLLAGRSGIGPITAFEQEIGRASCRERVEISVGA